jgi:hypothetical protein
VQGQRGDLGLDLVALPEVVGVEERDEVAAHGGDAGVARGRHPGVSAAQVPQARIV